MNVGIRNVLIAAGVGGSVIVAGAIASAMVPGLGNTTSIMGMVMGSGVLAALTAKSKNRKLPVASGEAKAAALAFPFRPGMAQIAIARRKKSGKTVGFDVACDEAIVSQLMAGQFVILTVPAGGHRIAVDFATAPGASAAAPTEIAPREGDVLLFETRVKMGVMRSSVFLDTLPDSPEMRAALGRLTMVTVESA